MKDIILNFPKQFKAGIESALSIKVKGTFSNVVICGLGGSALPGSLLSDFGLNLKIPIITHRDYGLPKIASENSLVICISFSGNTEETLSAFQEAIDKNYKTVGVCTGGKLKQMAEENNLPVAIVPNDCLQPRFGTGYLMGAVSKILINAGIISNITEELVEMENSLTPKNFEMQGKNLANKLIDKIPIIYASNQFKSVAKIWKIKFNENSKIMAFWNYFPELNHNEMVGLTNLKANFHFIILQDNNDHEKNKRRMELFCQIAKEKKAEVDLIEMQGKTKLEKIFNALLLGDWASYYLAQNYGIDPILVEVIEKFKKQL